MQMFPSHNKLRRRTLERRLPNTMDRIRHVLTGRVLAGYISYGAVLSGDWPDLSVWVCTDVLWTSGLSFEVYCFMDESEVDVIDDCFIIEG